MIRIGTAGWSIPASIRERFPVEGSTLQRYATQFDAVEINSSFYRPHKPETYARWAASTPEGFRFAIKLPKAITHDRRLVDIVEPLERFLAETSALGDKRGPILIQLPPSLQFDPTAAEAFFERFRKRHDGEAALEPRHASWFSADSDTLMIRHRIGRVAGDPALCPQAAAPGGWTGFSYWRLHGSPRTYATEYGPARIAAVAQELGPDAWVIFDNTMFGAATQDALLLKAAVNPLRSRNPDAKLGP